jgi:heavy metal translocating P-type ATPase
MKKTEPMSDSQHHSLGLDRILKVKLVNSIFAAVFLITGLVYEWMFPEQFQMAQLLIAIGAVVVSLPVFANGLRGLFNREACFMTEQLVSLAILAAMIEGDFAVATVIPIILVFGHLLEEKSIMGVEEAIASLKKLHSSHARLLKDGHEVMIDPAELKIDDLVLCYPGETIAADGVITEGETMINQAPITGESLPVEAFTGIGVFSGTVNLSGKICIKVTRPASDTLFNKIVRLLKEAEQSKAPIVKIIEKYLSLYFPFVIMVAAITLFLTSDISRAITILIISCPCALILASPTAMIAALVTASRYGIMIKNTAFLELLAEVDTIIFDKTGTVTLGNLEVEKICPTPGISESELLQTAALCASGSIHPVSASLVAFVHSRGIKFSMPARQTELHGKGVRAEHEGKSCLLGKLAWILEETGLEPPAGTDNGNGISVWVATDKNILGEVMFSDRPRPEMRQAIDMLRNIGIDRVVLLTGDKQNIGKSIGEYLGVDEIICECLPQDKLNYVNGKKEAGSKVMFVGDGINDALALKASDVGIAIARGGSDIAIQNSDITLNSDSLMNLTKMFTLSEQTRSIINQNIMIGTGFSLLLIVFASVGLISPVTGAVAHNLGPVFVVLNSARMLKEN